MKAFILAAMIPLSMATTNSTTFIDKVDFRFENKGECKMTCISNFIYQVINPKIAGSPKGDFALFQMNLYSLIEDRYNDQLRKNAIQAKLVLDGCTTLCSYLDV